MQKYNVEWDFERHSVGWWDESFPLSNVHKARFNIELDGIIYPSVEHAYQSIKFQGQQWIVEEIASIDDPIEVAENARTKYSKYKPANWNSERKGQLMYVIQEALVRQNVNVARLLLKSKGWFLYENIPGNEYDPFWGLSKNGGENWNGKNLMEIRLGLIIESEFADLGYEVVRRLPAGVCDSLEKFKTFYITNLQLSAESLGVSTEGYLNFEILANLEELFMESLLSDNYYGQYINPTDTLVRKWNLVVRAYNDKLISLNEHQFLDESLRYKVSRILQINNKFTASWDDINLWLEKYQ